MDPISRVSIPQTTHEAKDWPGYPGLEYQALVLVLESLYQIHH